MPELPEVETIRLQLERGVKGAKISDVKIIFSRKISPSANALMKAAKGAVIEEIGRRAKLLFLRLSSGYALIVHLKMTGRVLLAGKDAKPDKHTFVAFKLSDGRQIFWSDIRKFGFLKIVSTDKLENFWKKEGFGQEPLASDFTPNVLAACLSRHKSKKIKPLLMEQKCVAGLGNIYAAEALWYAEVHPSRPAGKLSEAEIKKLHEGIKNILPAAIKSRGTSADAYVDLFGKQGEYVPKLKVYGREGESCLRRDGGVIQKVTMAGRGTYFCPRCQK